MSDTEETKQEMETEEKEESEVSDVEEAGEKDSDEEEKEEEQVKQESSPVKKPSSPDKKSSPTKKASTPSKKTPDKEDIDDEEEEESGDEEQEEEEKIGFYDKPVVLQEGLKRERKKVERLSATYSKAEEKTFVVPKGKGTPLGECDFIEFKLSRIVADDLKPLHRIIFKRAGSAHEIKKNIRKFSGFPFDSDDKEYETRAKMLSSKAYTIPMIKSICDTLDIPKSGKKDDMIERLLEFLLKPTDSGRNIPKSKRKRKSEGKKKGKKEKGTKKKGKSEKPKAKKKKKVEDEEEEDEESEEDEVEESEEEEEEEEEEQESEEEEPPKKKAKPSKRPKKEEKKKEKASKKEAPKKKEPKKAAKKVKAVVSSDDDEDESSDDEPLVKKSEGPPSNEEIKEVIKKILDNANLEMVTMKTVVKDVYAKYPKYDLTEKKDFIKNTVRQIIS